MSMAIPINAIQNVLGYLVDERENFIEWLYEEHDYSCSANEDGDVSDEELKDVIEELGLDNTDHVYVALLEIEEWLDEQPDPRCKHCGGETAMNDGHRQCQNCGAW